MDRTIKTLILSTLIVIGSAGASMGRPFSSHNSTLKPEEARKKTLELLDKLDRNGYLEEDETLGFASRIENRWLSPFSYDFYFGTVSTKNNTPVIRVEGTSGDVRMMTRILEIEKIINPPADTSGRDYRPLSSKYQAIAQPLNLIAPWIGVLYTSYHSPRLSTGQTVFRFITYFLADALLTWAAGRDWFRHPFDAVKYRDNIIAVLAVPRLIGAVQTFNLVRGHNRVVDLKFTFPVE